MMDANTRLVKTKMEFKKQLMQFRKMILQPAQAFKDAKFVYSGKAKKGMKDDLVMTLMIGAFWGREFVRKRIQGVPYERLVM